CARFTDNSLLSGGATIGQRFSEVAASDAGPAGSAETGHGRTWNGIWTPPTSSGENSTGAWLDVCPTAQVAARRQQGNLGNLQKTIRPERGGWDNSFYRQYWARSGGFILCGVEN